MSDWKQSSDGRWSLGSRGRSLSLPQGFELDHADQNVTAFTGVTPTNEMSWVAYERKPAQEILESKFNEPDFKVLGVRTIGDLEITEIAPTTPSGRARAKIRFYFIELSSDSSLAVFGGGELFARSLAQQWVAQHPGA